MVRTDQLSDLGLLLDIIVMSRFLRVIRLLRIIGAKYTDIHRIEAAVQNSGHNNVDGSQHDLCNVGCHAGIHHRSEEHTSELQSLMRISYAVFCLKKKKTINNKYQQDTNIR